MAAFCFIKLGMDIKSLQQKLRKFAKERDWEKYHSPKNLASALSVEAAELLEIFQWLGEKDKFDKKELEEEAADILLYLLRLADVTGVDLEKAANEKMKKNAKKYPVALSRGKSTKYNKL